MAENYSAVKEQEILKAAKKARLGAFSEAARRLGRNKVAIVGLVVILLLIVLAIIAPYICKYKYDEINPLCPNATPSWEHPFGTDLLGRDQFSRVIYGSRYSLLIAASSEIVGLVSGVLLGAVAGYFSGILSDIIMRACDILQAIPNTLMAIVIAQTLGGGFASTVVALAVSSIPGSVRIVRALILQIRGQEYIEASRAITCTDARIIFRHVLPNTIPQLIISFTGGLSGKFTQSAGLSYLGLGIQPPTPEWGALLSAGKSYFRYFPHLVLFPGLFIMIAALSFNLLGDGLRDALDPRLRD